MGEYLRNQTFQLCDHQLDLDLWQILYYKYQKDYVRKRLLGEHPIFAKTSNSKLTIEVGTPEL